MIFFFLGRAEGYRTNNHRNVSELLDNLLRGYDNSIRPDFGGEFIALTYMILFAQIPPHQLTRFLSWTINYGYFFSQFTKRFIRKCL